ncbi:MAG: hydrogenase maturation peptidase HycI [Methanobacterium sp.]|nr:hydrogenase maturation peptidase HycI [Methanobacterium sp.]
MEFLQKKDKLVILGIGNPMRGDDFLGSLLARRLDELFSEKDELMVIDGGTVPENFTGLIKKENPSQIIIIDAARMGKTPGHIKIIKKDKIAQYNLSTHAMPLSFLIKYLEHSINADILLIGIQPKETELVETISDDVKMSIEYLIKLFQRLLGP